MTERKPEYLEVVSRGSCECFSVLVESLHGNSIPSQSRINYYCLKHVE